MPFTCTLCSNLYYPFPNEPLFLRVCCKSLLKTLWEKEKLLVTSNFSFSHSAFFPSRELYAIFINFKIAVCKLFQFGRVQNVLFGIGIIHIFTRRDIPLASTPKHSQTKYQMVQFCWVQTVAKTLLFVNVLHFCMFNPFTNNKF